MDSNKFSEFFGGVPVFHIPECRTFPVTLNPKPETLIPRGFNLKPWGLET